MSSEVVEVQATELPTMDQVSALTPFDITPDVFLGALQRRENNRQALLRWIKDNLKEGTDYGRIHVVGKNKCPNPYNCQNPKHFSKPSLWKPGAEKIAAMLGLIPRYENMHRYEEAAYEGREIKTIILKCSLYGPTGTVVAEGMGARNIQQDYGDINKSLKMAAKSAFIDAVLRVGGLSEIFTQDLEDMDPDVIGKEVDTPVPSQAPPNPQASQTISEAQKKRLEAIIREKGIDRNALKEYVKKHYRVESLNHLTREQYKELNRIIAQKYGD